MPGLAGHGAMKAVRRSMALQPIERLVIGDVQIEGAAALVVRVARRCGEVALALAVLLVELRLLRVAAKTAADLEIDALLRGGFRHHAKRLRGANLDVLAVDLGDAERRLRAGDVARGLLRGRSRNL